MVHRSFVVVAAAAAAAAALLFLFLLYFGLTSAVTVSNGRRRTANSGMETPLAVAHDAANTHTHTCSSKHCWPERIQSTVETPYGGTIKLIFGKYKQIQLKSKHPIR